MKIAHVYNLSSSDRYTIRSSLILVSRESSDLLLRNELEVGAKTAEEEFI